jgi:class 3 adenylate cyclase
MLAQAPRDPLCDAGPLPGGGASSEPLTLLFTDVVDSTLVTERLGDAQAAQLWSAHDRLARDLMPAFGGREIDKTDGLLVMFTDTAAAARYAAAYHQALQRLTPPLKARAGLHVGPLILRENSPADVARGAKPLDVEGLAKVIAARIMSLAQGGQTLLSLEARQHIDGQCLRVLSHGHWRLKGLAEPVELFEVGEHAAAFLPPPDAPKAYRVVRDGDLWLPAREIRHNLVAERDTFIGRRDLLDELARQIDAGERLVCVTGMGGAGKSRFATRFAWTWIGEFPGGAWFCDLSMARGIDGICQAVGQALDVPLGREDPVVQLGNAISARGPCLVILDNFEQVSRHAEATLGQWLNRAGEARFLVTSRNVLGLAGERVLALSSLPP